MKLECYAVTPEPPALVPARPARNWMDASPQRFACRCLPLNIANGYGWELLSPCSFAIRWNGGPAAGDIHFAALDGYPHLSHFAVSHFNQGIVTFHTGYLFRTAPGWDMLATGPLNEPKDGIAALSGIVETDWLPFPFTMNWQLTRQGEVRFEKGEPFCLIVPVQRGALEPIQPEIRDLADNPALAAECEAWKQSRATFIDKLQQRDEETMKQAWQRFYFKGETATGDSGATDHSSRMRLAVPTDRRTRHTGSK
ncbi:MAG TPA: DUF6065 family protein [Rhodocyclaceae bacterium]|nr:DUF6065 family protein [Rhodocyclaceae bacterium]HNI00368.1 DUF6065 family protein [Rhodocyclaceae bacterium]